MNTFYEHHESSIRFGYRCFDRILINGLIQPFQQPERVVGFFTTYRDLYPVSKPVLKDIAAQYQRWVTAQAKAWRAPIVDAPAGRRDAFVEPYFRRAKPDQVVVIVKGREPARILTHFESDYGAAPKVEMKVGQVVTNLIPDFASRKWVGFIGTITDNPFLDICRSQIDIRIHGDTIQVLSEPLVETISICAAGRLASSILAVTGIDLKVSRRPTPWVPRGASGLATGATSSGSEFGKYSLTRMVNGNLGWRTSPFFATNDSGMATTESAVGSVTSTTTNSLSRVLSE